MSDSPPALLDVPRLETALDVPLLRKALTEMSAAFGDRAQRTDCGKGALADDLRHASAQCRAAAAALSGLVEDRALLDRVAAWVLANPGKQLSVQRNAETGFYTTIYKPSEACLLSNGLSDDLRKAINDVLSHVRAAPALREEAEHE